MNITAPDAKYVNDIFHDLPGLGLWTPATGAEMNGCLMYHNGWSAPDRGHGHGIYIQNDTPAKLIKDCIIFDNFGYGIHAYTEGGKIDNLIFDGCVCFGAGSLYGEPYNNILVGGLQIAHNITIRNCMTYGAGGWNGKRYWMAVTPYTNEESTVERVCILVSDDKTTWAAPAGLTNPITDIRSDPDLINIGGTLYVVYRNFGTPDSICLRSSTDGIVWLDESTIVTGSASDSLLSPAVVSYGGQYLMFTVKNSANPPIIERRTCATLNGVWSVPTTCATSDLLGLAPWHLDVIADGTTLYMALNLSAQYLKLGVSTDGGLTWTMDTSIVSPRGGMWDAHIYRSTIVRTATGFDLWYSANDNGSPKMWHVGYTPVLYEYW